MVLFSDNGNLLFPVVFDLLPRYTRTINTSTFNQYHLINYTVYNVHYRTVTHGYKIKWKLSSCSLVFAL